MVMKGTPNNLWWGPPKNFSDRQYERKISWLELFYDLVYVAAVGQLTHQLSQHPTWNNAGYAFLLFSLIFWSWVNGSQYYDLHGNDSIRTRLLTFWQMLAMAAAAISIPDAFEGHTVPFTVAFATLQILITYLWWSVGLYDPSHRVFNKFYTVNYLIAFALILISPFTNGMLNIALWIIILILDLTPPLTGAHVVKRVLKERGEVFTASASLVERFGLFTIIVLAETILATVSGVAEVKDKHPVVWGAFILSIFIAFMLWSLYFDMTSEQETKKGYGYMQWLAFLHFPLLASFCVTGACIKVILLNIELEVTPIVQWMLCIALATTVLSIVGITRIMKEEEEDRVYIKPVSRLLIFISILMLLIPFIGCYFNNITFLSIIAVVLFIPVFIGVRSWIRYKFFNAKT